MTKGPDGRPALSEIYFESGVSAFTGDPFLSVEVAFTDGTRRRGAQMTPQQAREHALHVLEAAEAAVHDAAMHKWLKEKVGMDPEQAAAGVHELRDYRTDQR